MSYTSVLMPLSLHRQRGLTLIEILIAIGILGTLASVVIVAMSPKKNLLAARDTERVHHSRQLENAGVQYLINNGVFPNETDIPTVQINAAQICTQGVTTNSNCVQFDTLVPDYLVAIPRDSIEHCPVYTGYMIYLNGGFIEVDALHLGKMPDDDVTVTPGCTGASSSSSSVVSSSSSSFSTSSPESSSSVSSSLSTSSSVSSGGSSSSLSTSSSVSSGGSSSSLSTSSSVSSSSGVSSSFPYKRLSLSSL